MGFSLGGLVRAATESTLNIVMPGRGIVRAVQTGDPSHLLPWGQSYKEGARQLSSVLEKPAKEAAAGFAEGIKPDLDRVKGFWSFLSNNRDDLVKAAVLTSPGLAVGKLALDHPREAAEVAARAWKIGMLGPLGAIV